MPRVTVLGPQRLKPALIGAVRDQKIKGKIATVTAGWQEREDEDQELDEHLEGRTVNLRLYRRAQELLDGDRELADGLRYRQDRLKDLQNLYRIRLDYVLQAARDLIARPGDDPPLEKHRQSAVLDLRRLDEEHVESVREVHQEYEDRLHLANHAGVAEQRAQIAEVIEGCDAIAIAGGHVAVLLNRLRLFDLASHCRRKPLLVWSAGAMATGQKVVLFHDSPPQGQGNPEVLDVGLGLFEDLVPLPHARHRLRMHDVDRVALFARRFAPSVCVALDEGARVDLDGERWTHHAGTIRLDPTGIVVDMGTEQ